MCPTSHYPPKSHNPQPATYQATTTNQHELAPTNNMPSTRNASRENTPRNF
nr:MAG TPA: hypothetical protein [Caudoviricetes sp.]